MHPLKESGQGGQAQHSATLLEARVAMVLDETHCLLTNGRQANRALSCLVSLQAGDLVLTSQTGQGGAYVLHVLERAALGKIVLSAPACQELAVQQSRISLQAMESIDLLSAGDASVTAATGTLSLNAQHLFATVSETIVQQCRHFVGKAGQYLLEVRHLLKQHGQDVLLTAERDIKADAERISMG